MIETVGGVVSDTVTVKLPVAWLPAGSTALQLTVVVASGNADPDAGAHDGVSAVPPSVAVAEYVTVFDVAPFTLTAIGEGRVRFGGVVS